MLALKYSLLTIAIGAVLVAAGIELYDLFLALQHRRRMLSGEVAQGATEVTPLPPPIRWRLSRKLALLALIPLLASMSIVVVPSGEAGVRVSQISGTRPGTLYPGVHFVKPLLEYVVTYDTRDRVFVAGDTKAKKTEGELPSDLLTVQAREGLSIGLAVTVRYRLDPRRLDYIHSSLPQPVETQIVPPVIASAFRDLAPSYTVREIFATKRDEVRQKATEAITQKLAQDGILVKEVMLRDIQLPTEYAKGLEGLLLKEQESDRLTVETDIQQKNVRIAELEAEAQKARQVKQAEGQAQVRVLQAKSEADAMQYTLPLKEKQIQQTRLEAEARKEQTIKDAEAEAQAKVIDSKAELERRKLLAEAEANRIRVTAAADSERMRAEAVVLKQNPLLINKIIAERLSDKVQIMMVPTDGKFFFNDVLRSPFAPNAPAPGEEPEEPARKSGTGGQR